MRRALELARSGRGGAEPNPLVGCAIVNGAQVVGEGWHDRFGGPHAEAAALAAAGERARGGTLYVTLEPCCHTGKTPPCTKAIAASGIRRVVAAMTDPFPLVAGGGLAELSAAGLAVEVGLLEREARRLNAPYLKRLNSGRPWVIAKWAMSLDGKIATATGESRWISGESSRTRVHQLRGLMDGIVVGSGTAAADDPLLTARPPGRRTPLRIVLDSHARLADGSQLLRTARETPVLVATSQQAPGQDLRRLKEAGCEVLVCAGETRDERLDFLLLELGSRGATNLLVEGGAVVLGTLLDMRQIDEFHVFIAPIAIGGDKAPSPIAGVGAAGLEQALACSEVSWEMLDRDLYFSGRREAAARAGE